ncbi:MAG: hypothetical protein GY946_07965 [bacterium]|nr:hypothetical protein [bacterium]
MLKLSELALLGRHVRQDDWSELGIPTPEAIVMALDEGRVEDAKQLAQYLCAEGKSLHDLMCDWVWDLLTRIAQQHGEEQMFQILRGSQETWMMKRSWKAYLRMSVEERVHVTAEISRSHRCGPEQDGTLEVVEEEDRYTVRMDPCGSGGRMRRGDPVDGTPSRLGPPYDFGVTREPHPWSWGRAGVPYYCTHCALNELLPMEWGGHPLWVTEYNDDANAPCAWHFYKRAELIPDEVYQRVGREKPEAGDGRY